MPIPARLSDNLTVSTMHGCPPDEVESIGRYFITERKYNTTIKLNPTLLGPERLRDILNTQLGYDGAFTPSGTTSNTTTAWPSSATSPQPPKRRA